MNRILLILPLLALSFAGMAQFPGCPMVDAGPDETIACSNPCVTLTATPFDAGATTSYTVGSVPYAPPVSFGQAGGTGVSVGIDDVWSGVITLPFDFCFYGQTYNQCVIGSNGAISFDLSNANGFHPWSFTASCPSAALAPAGNILGPYHDIDPSVGGNVQYYILGSAPCRIFVVAFNTIPMYSCTNLSTSHMMVLYETTNAIDVYIEYREVCSSWNSGNAVVGIQNTAGTVGMAAPGRQTGPWAVSSPEGWRFLPSGAPIYTVEWLENGNVISTADTATVCPVVPTNYVAQATYTSCNGTVIVETDTVFVDVTSTMTVTEVTNNPTNCGSATGSVTVSASGGSGNYQYSFDDTLNFQSSATFNNLPAGTYIIYVQDDVGCIGGIVITIAELNAPTLSEIASQDASCGWLNGSIEVDASGGTQPFDYQINGGTAQSSGLFSSLDSGTYVLTVTDAGGCLDSLIISITTTPAPTISLVSSDTVCSGMTNGVVEVTATGGSGPYQYNVNGGAPQSSGMFSNQGAGSADYIVVDSLGCSDTVSVTVDIFPSPSIFADTVACNFGFQVSGTSANSGGEWITSDPEISFSPSATALNPNITASAPGVYIVGFVDGNCPDTLYSQITFPQTPSIFGDTSVCDLSFVVTGTDVYSTGGVWSESTGNISFSASANETNPTINATASGVYVVTFTDNACNNSDQATIEFIGPPSIFGDTVACNFGIFVNNTSSYAGGIWSCADTAVHFNPNNTVDNPEIYTIGQSGVYTVTYTDNACGTQISSDIDFVEYPSTWLNDTLLCNGTVYNLVAPNSNAHITNYQWNNGTPGETIQITEPGVYILTMTNVCHTGVDSISIEYQLCDINVPNVLSIAEGSQNSLWYVQTEGLGEFHVFITNRWGNVVYECDDAAAKCYWDGRAQNGTFVNAGTYFYTIEAKDMNGSPLIKNGFITVVE